MVKKIKKARVKELQQPDEFITLSARVLEYVVANKKQTITIAAVIVAVVLAVSGYLFYSANMEKKAGVILSQRVQQYETAVQSKSPKQAYDEVAPEFESFLEKHGGRKIGQNGRLIFANICFKSGHYDQAIKLYQQGLADFKDQPYIRALILNSMGFVYEAQKAFPKAIEYFDKAASDPSALMKDEAFFHLGTLYQEIGKTDKSEEAYQKIVSDYTDSIFINVVKEKVEG